MTQLTLDGKLYRIGPSGLVWAGYTHSSSSGTLWRRMEPNSIKSQLVRIAAGMETAGLAQPPRKKSRHYADRHCI